MKKKRQGEEKANVSWIHSNSLGNTLAICRNTGKSFHRFLRSVRVTRNPVSTRLGFHRIERVLSTLTARKNTRGWNLSAQNSHRNGISLCPPHSYPVGTRFDFSCMCVKFWGRFPFEKFPRKERKKSALSRVLCKLNHVAFHSLDTRYINTRRKGSMTRARPAFLWIVGESTSIIETILSANIVQVTQWKSYKIVHALVNREDETLVLTTRVFYFAAS